jgi:hypothetical protein
MPRSIDQESWCLADFQHGWYKSRAAVDPLGSYTTTVKFIKNGGKGSRQGQSLENIIKNFPEGVEVDYGALEAMLPNDISEHSPEYDTSHYTKKNEGVTL